MPLLDRSSLPNIITVGRIVLTPLIFYLILVPDFGARLAAFVLFNIAAVSDLWDGYLARKYDWISDFGKIMDPLADKLLLASAFIPLYIVSHQATPIAALPFWGTLPLWVLIVVFGRELAITLMRARASRRGIAVPAGSAGKFKAAFQNIFSGAAILWYAFQTAALHQGWSGEFWEGWQVFHGAIVALTLAVAVGATVYSLIVYLRSWRSMEQNAR